MTRRDLIQKVLLGGTTLIVLPSVLESCTKIDTTPSPGPGPVPGGSGDLKIDLASPSNSALNTAGGTVLTNGVIVANTGSSQFVALASACTHAGCTIGYSLANNNFPCPCHGSVFSITGSVLNGPADTPLKSYSVSKTGDILTIK